MRLRPVSKDDLSSLYSWIPTRCEERRLARGYIHATDGGRPCWVFGHRRLGWLRYPCRKCARRLVTGDFRRWHREHQGIEEHVKNSVPVLRRALDGTWQPVEGSFNPSRTGPRCGRQFGRFTCALPKGHP